jgi:hypothetical protein
VVEGSLEGEAASDFECYFVVVVASLVVEVYSEIVDNKLHRYLQRNFRACCGGLTLGYLQRDRCGSC